MLHHIQLSRIFIVSTKRRLFDFGLSGGCDTDCSAARSGRLARFCCQDWTEYQLLTIESCVKACLLFLNIANHACNSHPYIESKILLCAAIVSSTSRMSFVGRVLFIQRLHVVDLHYNPKQNNRKDMNSSWKDYLRLGVSVQGSQPQSLICWENLTISSSIGTPCHASIPFVGSLCSSSSHGLLRWYLG